jgi:hypothetical protein
MKLEMRGLDPVSDLGLLHEAYIWRANQNLPHLRPGRMPFEQWLESDSPQVIMGLFNGEFLAVYLIKEFDTGKFDLHFTSKRGVSRQHLVAGGVQVTNWLVENGALEVSALIVKRNRPLRQFLEDCGYSLDRELTFIDSPRLWLRYVAR